MLVARRYRTRSQRGKALDVIEWNRPNRSFARELRDEAQARSAAAARSARSEAPSLFPGLVLGWINADFRVQIRIFQHFSSSTRKSSSRKQISKSLQNFTEFCKNFEKILEILRKFAKFCKISKKKLQNFLQNFAPVILVFSPKRLYWRALRGAPIGESPSRGACIHKKKKNFAKSCRF